MSVEDERGEPHVVGLASVKDFVGQVIEDLKDHPKYPQYQKLIVGWDDTGAPDEIWTDVYGILVAYKVTNPATAHAIKKCLRAGTDHNETMTDLQEAKDALDRAMEIERGKA